MRGRALLALAVAGSLAAAAAHAGLPRSPIVRVTPSRSLEDQPLAIRVDGLAPHAPVTLVVASTDGKGIGWRSSTAFRADAGGAVDVRRSRALGGSYAGTWAMGPVAAMRPTRPDPYGWYFWGNGTASRFWVTVRAGRRTLARTSFTRRWSAGPLAETSETVSSSGFMGDFFSPGGARGKTAVLVFGGSEGGLSTTLLAARFAADGYPSLALAYFAEPGLPQTLSNIPLEYFEHALQWLAARPEVDPKRIVVLGISRGSEAALLLGVHYPALVHGVIALVPSSVVNCGILGARRSSGCIGPAWTIDGKPIPYTAQFDNPHPTDVPAAVIPVEQIAAPILLACGGQDTTWRSCAYAHAILGRLSAHHAAGPRSLYAYPQAGHNLGFPLPDEPGVPQSDVWVPQDEQAREHLWPHIVRFVAALR